MQSCIRFRPLHTRAIPVISIPVRSPSPWRMISWYWRITGAAVDALGRLEVVALRTCPSSEHIMKPDMPFVPTVLRAFLLPPVTALIGLGFLIQPTDAATEDGALRMEVIMAYNLVVDSNIESPAGRSPSAAHFGVKICNTGATTLTNVVVNMGRLTNPLTSIGTPGTFASRTDRNAWMQNAGNPAFSVRWPLVWSSATGFSSSS